MKNRYITLDTLEECPKCHQHDFMLISEKIKEALSLDRHMSTVFREMFCTHCHLEILEVFIR